MTDSVGTLHYDAASASDGQPLPLLLVIVDPDDPFVTFMTSDAGSIDGFLAEGPSGAQVVFSSSGTTAHLHDLRSRITARLTAQPVVVRSKWQGHLHFTNATAKQSISAALLDATTGWLSPRNAISVENGTRNISRLDCHYTWCPWPTQDATLHLSYAGDACSFTNTSNVTISSLDVLLNISHTINCSVITGVNAVIRAGARNVVLAEQNGAYPTPLGAAHPEMAGPAVMVTTVSAQAGAQLRSLMTATHGSNGTINATLPTLAGAGQFLAVDATGRLAEVGWEKYALLQMVSWEAAWLDYTRELHQRLMEPAMVIPVFDRSPIGSTTTIRMPPRTLLQSFASMQLDFALSCAGNMDRDCSVWDRIATVTADCGGTAGSFEVGRWINAFQRRVGRWLTTTPLMPAFFPDHPAARDGVCNITASIGMGDKWLVSLNIRFANDAIREEPDWGQPALVEEVEFPNSNDDFNGPAYNINRTVSFRTGYLVKRVAVMAIITGHGGCEFEPTSHHWIVNGQELNYSTNNALYYDRFMQAGTPFGCANKTRLGAVPNEHGTWYFGRNGWCDGQARVRHSATLF